MAGKEKLEPISAKIGRFFLLIGAITALSAGVVIVQRLSQDALALLVGLGCGISAMAPLAALLLFVWRRQEERIEAQRTLHVESQAATPLQPPIIVMSPPMLPGGYQNSWETSSRKEAAAQWESAAPRERRFKMMGGEEL